MCSVVEDVVVRKVNNRIGYDAIMFFLKKSIQSNGTLTKCAQSVDAYKADLTGSLARVIPLENDVSRLTIGIAQAGQDLVDLGLWGQDPINDVDISG